MTGVPDTASRTRSSPTLTLVILALGALAYTMAQTMIVPALPRIQQELGVSTSNVTWLLTLNLLAAAIATPITGRLGDMFGKERLLLISLGVFALGSLIPILGHSFALYLLGRLIQGSGGAILPLAIGIIRDEFPRERVATGIGTISAMYGIGGGIALVISGVLVDKLGVDSIFVLSLLLSFIAAIATWRFVPESPVRVRAAIDYVGATLMATGLAGVLLAISEGNHWGWTSSGVLGLFAAGAIVLVLFGLWELRIPEPLIDMRLMRRRAMWTVNVAAFSVGLAIFGSFVLVPQLVQTPSSVGYGFGASVTLAGLYLLPSALLMFLAGPLSGRMSTRGGSRLPLALGAAFGVISCVMLAVLHDHPWQILVGNAILGMGLGLSLAAMANLVIDAVPQEQTGMAMSVNLIARSAGGAIGGQIAAAILTGSMNADGLPSIGGYEGAFLLSAAGAATALVVTAFMPRGRSSAAQARMEDDAARAEAPA
ncbi:unannotated protein [freshwater metagenome]|uniref:Unannotated protein n=1 Tax=freshwater metagenome TaxID=449393 RepID=A0A6J7CQ69_9ZZZZ|nr:MFS transporter [Actinomycetota bacterium]